MTAVLKHIPVTHRWNKLGRIIEPSAELPWMVTHAGAAVAVRRGDTPVFDVYVTGRDAHNRSRIGRIAIDIRSPGEVLEIDPTPVLSLGERGTFDENGTSYPCIVQHAGKTWMYYTGWVPTVLTPFQNHVGLAIQQPDGTFERVSRAPILERTHDDPLSTGAVFVIHENSRWRMWYTAFQGWGTQADEPKHSYVIKYAESDDGIHWQRENHIAIDLQHANEHSISRPTVIRRDGMYHMWYCYRGDEYRIGYAVSADGIDWTRRDEHVGITTSRQGWDSRGLCYPHLFECDADLYMLYCGNDYGRDGLGVAQLGRASL